MTTDQSHLTCGELASSPSERGSGYGQSRLLAV